MHEDPKPQPGWIKSREAARLLAVPVPAIHRLARDGRIRCRRVAGCQPRFLLDDCLRLARESVRAEGE